MEKERMGDQRYEIRIRRRTAYQNASWHDQFTIRDVEKSDPTEYDKITHNNCCWEAER